MAVDPYTISIQMKWIELTIMMISNWKKTFGVYGLYLNISALY